jgi:hypothetical protein
VDGDFGDEFAKNPNGNFRAKAIAVPDGDDVGRLGQLHRHLLPLVCRHRDRYDSVEVPGFGTAVGDGGNTVSRIEIGPAATPDGVREIRVGHPKVRTAELADFGTPGVLAPDLGAVEPVEEPDDLGLVPETPRRAIESSTFTESPAAREAWRTIESAPKGRPGRSRGQVRREFASIAQTFDPHEEGRALPGHDPRAS